MKHYVVGSVAVHNKTGMNLGPAYARDWGLIPITVASYLAAMEWLRGELSTSGSDGKTKQRHSQVSGKGHKLPWNRTAPLSREGPPENPLVRPRVPEPFPVGPEKLAGGTRDDSAHPERLRWARGWPHEPLQQTAALTATPVALGLQARPG